MGTNRATPGSIDEYIAGFAPEVQAILQAVRATIREAAPDAEETISYQIPTFTLNGSYLVYFAGYKKHVGLYPAPVKHPEWAEELSAYAAGKGTVRFPLDKPVPLDLITRLVKFLVTENTARAAARRKKKEAP